MNYERINWENAPSTDTPLDADNLNKMDEALDSLNREMASVREDYDELDGKADILDARITAIAHMGIEGSTTGDLELIDGRVGANGTTYESIGNAIRGQVGELNERLGDIESGEPYAPAIIAETEEAFSHDGMSKPLSVTFHGNDLAFGTAKYVDSVNYAPDYNVSSDTVNGITYNSGGHFVTLDGTGTGTSRFNVVKLEKAPAFPLDAGTYKYLFAMEKTGSTIGSSMRIFLQAQYTDGTSATLKDKYVTAGFEETVEITKPVRILRIDIGSYGGNVHDDTIIWIGLYKETATIIDTEETVSASGTLEIIPEDTAGITELDTMQHSSTVNYVANTKEYVDSLDVDINDKLTYITPEKFGAVGDGVADDTQALQNCIDYAINNANYARIVRAYGRYKITSSLLIHAYLADIYINTIIYTGNDAAVVIHSKSGKITIDLISATTGVNAVGVRCSATNSPSVNKDGFSDNRLDCGFIYANGNALEIIYPNSAQAEGIYYNVFRLPWLWSNNANLIYVNAPRSFAENDFYGKECYAPNGYLFYRENVHNNSTHVSTRLHQFSLEHNLKNGVYGNVALIECRSRELMDRRNVQNDSAGGFLFDFTGVVPNATKDNLGGDIDMTSIMYDAALTFDDVIDKVKDLYDTGERGIYPLASVLGAEGTSYALIKNCVRTSIGGYYTIPGDVFVYYNHIAYNPYEDWYCVVDDDMTIQWEPGRLYTTPTIFDIDGSSVEIHLDDSYCCIAINEFQLIQHEGKTAVVFDKLGNKIFDGTTLGAGTYRFVCSRVPLESLEIEMRNGDIWTFQSSSLVRVYTGENEKWTVSKDVLVETTS